MGVAFAYFLVLPMAFGFFATAAPKGVKIMTDINSFLDFTIGMTLAFGFAFPRRVLHQPAQAAGAAMGTEGHCLLGAEFDTRFRFAEDRFVVSLVSSVIIFG